MSVRRLNVEIPDDLYARLEEIPWGLKRKVIIALCELFLVNAETRGIYPACAELLDNQVQLTVVHNVNTPGGKDAN